MTDTEPVCELSDLSIKQCQHCRELEVMASRAAAEAKIQDQWESVIFTYAKKNTNTTLRPGEDMRRILLSLLVDGPEIAAPLARRCGVMQSNVAGRTGYLRRLERYRLVFAEHLGTPRKGDEYGAPNGGGRPAVRWHLTPSGHRLAEAIRLANSKLDK